VLDGWQLNPSVWAYVALMGILYTAGARRSRLRRTGPVAGRILAFYAGLLMVVVALESPIDGLAERYFWLHMLQHELLLMIAPPLLLLGKPVLTIWRVVPLGTRRVTARKLVKRNRLQSAWRSTGSWRSTRAAWLLFIATFALWHIPYVYDLTLRVPAVHVLEHGLFFGTALNFWARVISSPPIHRLRERTQLVAYLGGAALFDNVFDTLFVAAPQPLYSHYANLVRHPGALSALTDQSIAGGVMNLIGSTMLYGALVITWRSGGAARRNVGAAMRPAT